MKMIWDFILKKLSIDKITANLNTVKSICDGLRIDLDRSLVFIKELNTENISLKKEIDILQKRLFNEMVARKNDTARIWKDIKQDWVGDEMHKTELETMDRDLKTSMIEELNYVFPDTPTVLSKKTSKTPTEESL